MCNFKLRLQKNETYNRRRLENPSLAIAVFSAVEFKHLFHSDFAIWEDPHKTSTGGRVKEIFLKQAELRRLCEFADIG